MAAASFKEWGDAAVQPCKLGFQNACAVIQHLFPFLVGIHAHDNQIRLPFVGDVNRFPGQLGKTGNLRVITLQCRGRFDLHEITS